MKSDSPKKTVKKTARKPGVVAAKPVAAPSPAGSRSARARATGDGMDKMDKTDQGSQTVKVAKRRKAADESKAVAAKAPAMPPIPPVLLEGDEPTQARLSGPGERYALAPTPVLPDAGHSPEPAELPESYGTQRLFLTARDPQWVHAHWDFSHEQLRRYNARSRDRHLVLRVYKNDIQGEPHREIHVHPESRSWFVQVGDGSTRYVAQLGYYMPAGTWVTVAASSPTLTPSDTMSNDLSVWFETLPVEVKYEKLLQLVRQAVKEHVPLMEALQQLRTMGFPGLPDVRGAFAEEWTPAQEQALAGVVSMDAVRRVWMGSLEITELIRRQFLQELSSQAAAGVAFGETSSWSGAPSGVSSVSSPFGGAAERRKGFWFNVNAELIIYGATEPDASVTIGGRTIRLRPDGTFSYRFILPDGHYELPAIATSADGTDHRSAALEFHRSTAYRGDVQAHPQDPGLKPPRVEHV